MFRDGTLKCLESLHLARDPEKRYCPPVLRPPASSGHQLRARSDRGQTDGFGARRSTLELTGSSTKDSHFPASAPKAQAC